MAKKAKKTSRTLGEFLKDLAAISARAQEGDAEHGKAPRGATIPEASTQDSLERIFITGWRFEVKAEEDEKSPLNAALGVAFALLKDPERRRIIADPKLRGSALIEALPKPGDIKASLMGKEEMNEQLICRLRKASLMGKEEMNEQLIRRLRVLGVKRVEFSLNGGGDNGDIDIEDIEWSGEPPALVGGKADLNCFTNFPAPPRSFAFDKAINPTLKIIHDSLDRTFHDYMTDVVEDMPDFDWVNNEGGSGSIVLYPLMSDVLEECIENNMSPNEDEENDYDYEDDEELDQDDIDGANPSEAAELSTSHQHSENGDQDFGDHVTLSTSKGSWTLKIRLPQLEPKSIKNSTHKTR